MGKIKKISRAESSEARLCPRDAAVQLQISYSTIKQWIYHRKLRAVKTPVAITASRNMKSTVFFTAHEATTRASAVSPTNASVAGISSWGASSMSASAGWQHKSRYRWADS